jgi:hypothetical protein
MNVKGNSLRGTNGKRKRENEGYGRGKRIKICCMYMFKDSIMKPMKHYIKRG